MQAALRAEPNGASLLAAPSCGLNQFNRWAGELPAPCDAFCTVRGSPMIDGGWYDGVSDAAWAAITRSSRSCSLATSVVMECRSAEVCGKRNVGISLVAWDAPYGSEVVLRLR
jgi:hypothetical protein